MMAQPRSVQTRLLAIWGGSGLGHGPGRLGLTWRGRSGDPQTQGACGGWFPADPASPVCAPKSEWGRRQLSDAARAASAVSPRPCVGSRLHACMHAYLGLRRHPAPRAGRSPSLRLAWGFGWGGVKSGGVSAVAAAAAATAAAASGQDPGPEAHPARPGPAGKRLRGGMGGWGVCGVAPGKIEIAGDRLVPSIAEGLRLDPGDDRVQCRPGPRRGPTLLYRRARGWAWPLRRRVPSSARGEPPRRIPAAAARPALQRRLPGLG